MDWRKSLIVLLFVAVGIALAYHHRAQLSAQIVQLEQWIEGHGIWGPLVFTVLFIVLTSVFFPDSVLSAVAGALFGTLIGTIVVVFGAIVTQIIAFGISRHFLQGRVRRMIDKYPKFAAIQRAANREGLRLNVLLRLAPLNPVLVSHILGTTGSRFGVFVLACVGLIPALFVQVYCGYTAKHLLKAAGQANQHSTLETVLVVVGLIACVVLFVVVTRMAQKALAEAEQEPGGVPSKSEVRSSTS